MSEKRFIRIAFTDQLPHPSKLELRGVVKDISPLGLGIEVIAKNTINFSHDLGAHLKIKFRLPSGSSINEVAVIKYNKKRSKNARLSFFRLRI